MTSLIESADEWKASAISADDPVTRPAASFDAATITFAASAKAMLFRPPRRRAERITAAECRSGREATRSTPDADGAVNRSGGWLRGRRLGASPTATRCSRPDRGLAIDCYCGSGGRVTCTTRHCCEHTSRTCAASSRRPTSARCTPWGTGSRNPSHASPWSCDAHSPRHVPRGLRAAQHWRRRDRPGARSSIHLRASTPPALPLAKKRKREQALHRSLHVVTSVLDWQVDVRVEPVRAAPETPQPPPRYKTRLGVRYQVAAVSRPETVNAGDARNGDRP